MSELFEEQPDNNTVMNAKAETVPIRERKQFNFIGTILVKSLTKSILLFDF